MAAATESAAAAHPSDKFAIVDCSSASQCLTGTKEGNIDDLVFNTAQDGFLGGPGGQERGQRWRRGLGDYIGTLADGGVVLAPFHDYGRKVPAALVAGLHQVSAGIANGTIEVPTRSPVQ